MRIAFMGTPDFAVPALTALHAAGHEIAAIYSQPPRPAKRGQKLQLSPVHAEAERLGLMVRTPANFRGEDERQAFADLDLDVAIVAAYGLILPQAILDRPRHGCINLHASLLPRWRGAAPVQRAILAGDTRTGITLMQMEAGLDTGPMLMMREVDIDRHSAGTLTRALAEMGAAMIVDALPRLSELSPQPQPDDGVTYARKIDKAEAHLDFTQSAAQVERAVRAFNPAPGAWFDIAGERIKLLEAEIVDGAGAPGLVIDDALTIACGTGALRCVTVQRAGKSPMSAGQLLRGFAVAPGTIVS